MTLRNRIDRLNRRAITKTKPPLVTRIIIEAIWLEGDAMKGEAKAALVQTTHGWRTIWREHLEPECKFLARLDAP
jgi:hypothetical protein